MEETSITHIAPTNVNMVLTAGAFSPLVKICTKCNIEKDLSFYSKDKGQKSGYRPACKECTYNVSKKYRSSEVVKEKRRIAAKKYRLNNPERNREAQKKQDQKPERKELKRTRMAEWRKNNPELTREIAKKSYHLNFDKNKGVKNEKSRVKWRKEDNFREAKLKKMAEKYLLNRASFCVCCQKELPKNSSKYCDDCRDKNYKKVQKNWINKVGKDYINDLQNKRVKKKSALLTDGYIVAQIRGNKLPELKKDEIPSELIELKRLSIKLKRELKNK